MPGPLACVCQAIGMPSATVLLCFLFVQQLGVKTTNLKGHCKDLLLSSGGETHSSVPAVDLSQESSLCLCECLESMLKHSKKLPPGYPALCVHLSSLLLNSHSVLPSRSFRPWRGNILSSKCTPEKGTFSPCSTQGPPHHSILHEPYISFSLTLSVSPTSLREKDLTSPWHHVFSLPQFMALNLLSDTFSHSNCANCFLNPRIDFLVLQHDLM